MADFLEFTSFALFAVILLFSWLAGRAERGLAAHLHGNHPEIWARLVHPEDKAPILSIALCRFVWRREYHGVGDGILTSLGERARKLQHTSLAFLVLWIATGIAEILFTWQ